MSAPARRIEVNASSTGARLRYSGSRQQLERRVVVDLAVVGDHPAVAVACVFAQADVGDNEQLGMGVLDRARGQLHHPFVVPRARSLLVLGGGQPEQED